MQSFSDEYRYGLILGSIGNSTAEEMREHIVEILGHVVLCENNAVESEVGCSDAVIEVDVFYLFVEGGPKFTDVTSYEYSTAEGWSTF